MRVKLRPGEPPLEATLRLLQQLINAYEIERKQDMISLYKVEGGTAWGKNARAYIDARICEIRNSLTCIPVTMNPTKYTPVTFPQPTPPCLEVLSIIEEYSKVWADFEGRTGQHPLASLSPEWEVPKEEALRLIIGKDQGKKVISLRAMAAASLLGALESPYDPKARIPRELEHSPSWHANNGYVSGGNIEGVLQVLEQTKRTRHKPKVQIEHLTTAFLDLLLQYGVGKVGLEPPPFDESTARIAGFIGTKAAGYIPCKERVVELEDRIIKFSWTATKANSIHVVMAQIYELAAKVRDVLAGSTNGTVAQTFWPNLFAKIAIKSEVRSAETDRKKVRAFFVVAMLRGMVDKLIYEPAFKSMYDRGAIGIGFQKDHGGMNELYEELKGKEKGWFYVESDFSKYDQSMMASLLTIVFMVPLYFYKQDASKVRVSRYSMLREAMVWASDSIACSLVKWAGTEARMIVGIMFSGLFGTSWGGTVYAILVRKCFDSWMYDRLSLMKDPRAEAWKKTAQPYKQYGDDQIMAFREEFYDLITGKKWEDRDLADKPDVFSGYFQEAWGITLKPEETHVYFAQMVTMNGRRVRHPPLLTLLREERVRYHFVKAADDPVEEGTVRFVAPRLAHLGVYEFVSHRILYNGPKYLQRRFVLIQRGGETQVMYWRLTSDYYARAARTASENVTMVSFPLMRLGMMLLKLRGMMYDVGVNFEAYQFLRFVHDMIIHEHPGSLLTVGKWKKMIEESFSPVFEPSTAEGQVFHSSMSELLAKLTDDGRWRFGNICEQCPAYSEIEQHLFDEPDREWGRDREWVRTRNFEYWEIWTGTHCGKSVPLPSEYDRYLQQFN